MRGIKDPYGEEQRLQECILKAIYRRKGGITWFNLRKQSSMRQELDMIPQVNRTLTGWEKQQL